MIVIDSGKMIIPEEERFIGYAGDNLHSTKQFLVKNIADEDCIYRLYLLFDDGTTNHFVLDSKVEDGSTILMWTILEEHIFKSGTVKAQIKSINKNGVIYHTTSDFFIVASSAEFSENFSENHNAEFLRYERELNTLLDELNSSRESLVPESRKVAGVDLKGDISASELLTALNVKAHSQGYLPPTESTVGELGQLYIAARTQEAFICSKITSASGGNAYTWAKISNPEIVSVLTSESTNDQAVGAKLFYDTMNNLPTEAGKSAYQIALDNGFEGTQKEWLSSLRGADGEDGAKGDKGDTGANGADGTDGTSVTVTSVKETAEDGGSNIVTFSDGTTLTVKNGSKGSQGIQGVQGEKGEKGDTGATGSQGPKGDKGDTGATGPQGPKGDKGDTGATGQTGARGADGKTPVRGVDYWTQEDKEEIIAQLNNSDVEITYETRTGGYYTTSGSWTTDSNFNSKFTNLIPVTQGDALSYLGLAKWAAVSVIWYDENQSVISSEQYDAQSVSVIITAPQNAKYVRCFSFHNSTPTLVVEWIRKAEDATSVLFNKKIIYDGDSICYGAGYTGGYAKIIADKVNGTYSNYAQGGARLTHKPTDKTYHSVVDNIVNLPSDGDLYCFEGGINDYWTPKELGAFSKTDYTGTLDTNTICGALESIFRYALNTFVGKPIVFVITHKIQSTAYSQNTSGDTFEDYRNAMIGICEKYSIPYFDAFTKSGLNGWNNAQKNAYFDDADGIHPNEDGYKRYYVPQLISLFESVIPET